MASKGGYRPGSGNPGYGKQNAVREGVAKLTPLWFELAETWITGKDKRLKALAFQELGKLMNKSMPTEITGEDGSPIEIKMINYADK